MEKSWFMHFHADIIGVVMYAYKNVWKKLVHALACGYHYHAVYGGYRSIRMGEWRLNHTINYAEVINANLSDFSAEIDYSNLQQTINRLKV